MSLPKLRSHPSVLCCLIAALYLVINPYFRFWNIFQHDLIQTVSPFYFPNYHSIAGLKWTSNSDGPQANLSVRPNALIHLQNGFRGPLGPGGADAVVLNGQEHGSMQVRLPPPGSDAITIRVDVVGMPGGKAEIGLEVPARSFKRILARTSHLRQGGFRIDPWLDPSAEYLLTVEAQKGVVTVERFAVFETSKKQVLPPMDRILLVVWLIWLLVMALPKSKHSLSSCFLAVGIPLVCVSLGQLSEKGLWASSLFWLSLVYCLTLWHTFRRQANTRQVAFIWLMAILLMAFVLRWSRLMGQCLEPIDSDALAFCSWASNLSLSNPFATGAREPFYVWIDFLTMHILGPNAFQVRIVSVILSCMTVLASYYWARAVSGRRSVACLAAWVMSVSVFAVYASTSADRTQSFECLVLIFCFLMVRPGWTTKKILLVSVVSAFLCLNWLIGIVQVLTFLILWCCMRRISTRNAMAIAAITGMFLAPYFYVSWKQNGSALYALNVHANYWHNVDVNKVYGYEKESTTWVRFLLQDRGIPTLIRKTTAGYASMLFNPSDRYNRIFLGGHYVQKFTYFIFPLFLLGLFFDVYHRRYEVGFMFFSFMSISPYFSENSLSPRYFFYVAPFFAYWISSGTMVVLDFCRLRLRERGTLRFPIFGRL